MATSEWCEMSFHTLRSALHFSLSPLTFPLFAFDLSPLTFDLSPYTLHLTPYTLHLTPYTLHLFQGTVTSIFPLPTLFTTFSMKVPDVTPFGRRKVASLSFVAGFIFQVVTLQARSPR